MDHTTYTTHTFASLDTHKGSLLLLPALTHVVYAWAPSWGPRGGMAAQPSMVHPAGAEISFTHPPSPSQSQQPTGRLFHSLDAHVFRILGRGTWGSYISLLPQTTYVHRAHMHNARVSIQLACVSQRTLSERVRLRGRLSNRTSLRRLRPSGTEAYVSEVTTATSRVLYNKVMVFGYGFKLGLHRSPTSLPYGYGYGLNSASGVAPAPCSARARPCASMFGGDTNIICYGYG